MYAALLSGSSGGSEEEQSDQGTESGHGASDERRSAEEKGASDAVSEGDRSGSHRPQKRRINTVTLARSDA